METTPSNRDKSTVASGTVEPDAKWSDAVKSGGGGRVLLLGATGTIGRAVLRRLVAYGHDVVCVVRQESDIGAASGEVRVALGDDGDARARGPVVRVAAATDPDALAADGFAGERFDVVISCLASRTGVAADAWRVDYEANCNALRLAKSARVRQMILLSAICVQKPRLAFQQAKLAFEEKLIGSGLTYSIVRPTAFFKSLSGQIDRIKAGKPYLLFGDGALTACKPISDDDLAAYIVSCIDDKTRHNAILPIGGPGDAVTPREQGAYLFKALGIAPKYRKVPPAMLKIIARALSLLSGVSPRLREKAELARIGHYYATESMLALDPETGAYNSALTPSFGAQTLFDHYDKLIAGRAVSERGEHAVF